VAYIWLAACLLAGAMIWKAGRSSKIAALFLCAMLSPLLGFFTEYTFRYTFVADHYQYVASIGPLTLSAAALDKFLRRLGGDKKAGFGELADRSGSVDLAPCTHYADSETLWRATLASTPDSTSPATIFPMRCWTKGSSTPLCRFRGSAGGGSADSVAQNNLGFALLATGRVGSPFPVFQRAIVAEPSAPNAYYNLGRAYLQEKQNEAAVTNFQRRSVCNLTLRGLLQSWLRMAAIGHVPAAISNYEKSIAWSLTTAGP